MKLTRTSSDGLVFVHVALYAIVSMMVAVLYTAVHCCAGRGSGGAFHAGPSSGRFTRRCAGGIGENQQRPRKACVRVEQYSVVPVCGVRGVQAGHRRRGYRERVDVVRGAAPVSAGLMFSSRVVRHPAAQLG